MADVAGRLALEALDMNDATTDRAAAAAIVCERRLARPRAGGGTDEIVARLRAPVRSPDHHVTYHSDFEVALAGRIEQGVNCGIDTMQTLGIAIEGLELMLGRLGHGVTWFGEPYESAAIFEHVLDTGRRQRIRDILDEEEQASIASRRERELIHNRPLRTAVAIPRPPESDVVARRWLEAEERGYRVDVDLRIWRPTPHKDAGWTCCFEIDRGPTITRTRSWGLDGMQALAFAFVQIDARVRTDVPSARWLGAPYDKFGSCIYVADAGRRRRIAGIGAEDLAAIDVSNREAQIHMRLLERARTT